MSTKTTMQTDETNEVDSDETAPKSICRLHLLKSNHQYKGYSVEPNARGKAGVSLK